MQNLAGIDLSRIDPAAGGARYTLGQLYVSPLGNHYRYLQADGAVTAYLFYNWIPDTYQVDAPLEVAVNPADSTGVPLCVWDGSATALADNEYAWFFVGPGKFTATSTASIVAKAILYGHATVGKFDDTASACLLKGVTAPALFGSGTTGTLRAAYPLYAEDLP